MNTKIKSIKFFAIAIMALLSINAWGGDETITLTYSDFGLTTTYAKKTATKGGFGFEVNQGYKGTGNVIQMNSSKGNGTLYNTTPIPGLKSVTVNVSSGSKTYTIYQGAAQEPTSSSAGSASSTSTINISSGQYFSLKVSGASYFSSIVITYSTGGSSACATPTFSPSAGSYCGEQSVTISCATDGATIHYTTNGTTPTSSSTTYSSPISVSSSQTIKAIAVKGGMTDSEVASASYTIESPLSTADAIFSAATTAGSTATQKCVTFTNWVITGVNGNNAYITDGAGKGAIIYQSGHGFSVGDKLNGTVSCKVQLYNGAADFTQLTATTDGLTVTHDGVITPQEVAISSLSGVNTGAPIIVKGVTYGSSVLTDESSNSITPNNKLYSFSLENSKTYDVTGIYLQNNTTKQIMPRSSADIVEASSSDPCETSLDNIDDLFAAATAAGGTPTDICVTFGNWVVTGVSEGHNNTFVTDKNGKGLIISVGTGFSAGDILSGTVSCKIKLYQGSIDLENLTASTPGLVITKGGTVTPQVVSISDLNGKNTGSLITLNNVTYNSTLQQFEDGSNVIAPYSFLYSGSYTNGTRYNITGVYLQYNANPKEILPRSSEDIKEITYTIIVERNDASLGSVSLNGKVITATPNSCVGYSSTAYNVTSGAASVVQNGNEFTVTPTSDCTVRINFEALSSDHYVDNLHNNSTIDMCGNGYSVPSLSDESKGSDCEGEHYHFVGWCTATESAGKTSTSQLTGFFEASGTKDATGTTYYAVWAKEQ